MNIKNLLKNKFFIISAILIVLIVVFASLTQFGKAFYMVACFLTCALCVVIAIKFIFDVKELNKNSVEELLPLSDYQKQQMQRGKKIQKVNLIVRTVVFFIFALLFFIMAF